MRNRVTPAPLSLSARHGYGGGPCRLAGDGVLELDRSALLSNTVDEGAVLDRDGSDEVVERWLDRELNRIGDGGFATEFARACPVAGVPVEAYGVQWLPGHPGLLAGIRFKGGDVTVPFVELIAWDEPVTEPATWARVLARLSDRFSVFRSRFARVRWPGQSPPPTEGEPVLDQWLVAERLAVLRSRPLPQAPDAMSIAPVSDLSWCSRFEAAFAGWRSAAGELGDEVLPASREDFQECLERGAVVCLWAGGRWAGVAAARREDDRNASGYCVVEEFLEARFRGRGYAKALQRQLVEELSDADGESLWGNVHALNSPSLATAKSVGRRILEGWWFLPLPQAPPRPARQHGDAEPTRR